MPHAHFSLNPLPAASIADDAHPLRHLPAWIGLLRRRWRTRRELARLDDRLLADIGITREQAAEEAAKPFWQ